MTRRLIKKVSPRGAMGLVSHEAIVTRRYRDIKRIWTIAIGVTARAQASINPDIFREELSVEECLALFMEILPQYERGVVRALGGRECFQHEFDALVSLAYNVGAGLGPTTHKYIRQGRIVEAINLWRADPELHDRRTAEATLANTGEHIHKVRGEWEVIDTPKAWLLKADRHGKLLWAQGKKIDLTPYEGVFDGSVDPFHDINPELIA